MFNLSLSSLVVFLNNVSWENHSKIAYFPKIFIYLRMRHNAEFLPVRILLCLRKQNKSNNCNARVELFQAEVFLCTKIQTQVSV